jgi:hypothetical protein
MPPEQLAAIGVFGGLLGTVVGGLFGWAAARRVDEQRARREAYARYLAAVDEVVGRLARRMLDIRLKATGLEPEPDSHPARIAFTALLILASTEMVETANQLQGAGNELGRLTARHHVPFDADADDEWKAATQRYTDLRRTFIDRARDEVRAGRLPDHIFE